MKLVTVIATLIFGLNAFATDTFENLYTVGCDVKLIGLSQETAEISKVSEAKRAPDGPSVLFNLGQYTMAAGAQYSGSTAENMGPRLTAIVFKNGEGPIVGQVNFSGVNGFEKIQVGESRSLYSANFLDLTYEGKSYTRVDYTCTITRTK
ncbi:MAG: hypothetical protein V4736_06680 [Bdellovibrionota bacterium]